VGEQPQAKASITQRDVQRIIVLNFVMSSFCQVKGQQLIARFFNIDRF